MTGLGDIFAELGISHYLHDFIEQGFDTWDTILDITESDFDALGVKLGHRRKLQRKIANSRGLSSDRALASPRHTPSDDKPDEQRPSGGKAETKDATAQGSGPHGAKRKYRRHPKPDENAPERPPSAYVIFSNKMREELKGRNLSFTEIAKLVGENWQNLSPGEKEPYEQQAFSAKERYNNELTEYKKTERYKEYSQYLIDFKSRHSNSQQGVPAENTLEVESAKRPKLEAQQSTASSGTCSSNGSQHGEISTGRSRMESSASSTGQWHSSDARVSPKTIVMPRLAAALAAPKEHIVAHHPSAGMLPGYRESIYGVPPQSLPWREGLADGQLNLSQLASNGERRGSQASNIPVIDSLNLTGSAQHNHRTGLVHGQPPPSLRSESTNRSTGSSASTVSSNYFSPRTPMEPPLERALPIPALYPQKNGFDSQLPSLRPSLSPQSSVFPQHSAHSIHSMVDYSSSMAPMRGYPSLPPQQNNDARMRDLMNSTYSDDNNNLDPVSALIRAGEVINRNSRNRQSP